MEGRPPTLEKWNAAMVERWGKKENWNIHSIIPMLIIPSWSALSRPLP
jgi:hypothetical protein